MDIFDYSKQFSALLEKCGEQLFSDGHTLEEIRTAFTKKIYGDPIPLDIMTQRA